MNRIRSRGFTLLEVMVALAVFAMAAIAVLKSASEQLGTIPVLKERMFADIVAHNKMVDARLASDFPDLGNKEKGRVELADQQWYWRQEVVKTTDEEFRAIRIKVSLDSSFDNIISEVTTYVAKPD
ncbi:type II secretion system minor pseudopilin GspI [Ferrimonas aestuarii]|uniref:Type II secretion system protein I n=1 Tax=Ferrimonas aestuarii TaxID=2569539 RepID=A0A4U1BS98_9GAMM|nr:type II secretion system minor pseudopilin GspI [Ferrimonas aestuarii]TKB56222.1 type II secretion system protein GspI [Ferrimonas aestuarii]